MKPESQRIAIAKACGYSHIRKSEFNKRLIGRKGRGDNLEVAITIPDYLNDLNAMHEAEKVLTGIDIPNYIGHLENVVSKPLRCGWSWSLTHATAAQRAEAFLRTLGLWKD